MKRADLMQTDRDHLYEPGPAKHALERLLQYGPEDETIFRRGDGTGILAMEVLRPRCTCPGTYFSRTIERIAAHRAVPRSALGVLSSELSELLMAVTVRGLQG